MRQVPGVGIVESWGGAMATRVRPDGTDGDPITLTALPADSQMVQPTLLEGRWLLNDDENAIVISQNVLSSEPDVAVGDTIVLEVDGKETPWVIVGMAQVLGGPPNVVPAYVEVRLLLQPDGEREPGDERAGEGRTGRYDVAG